MTMYNGIPLSEPISVIVPETKVYTKRWLMLALFILTSMINAFQWIHFSIIAPVVQRFYNVESHAVDWTSMIYMVTYIPLIFPASYLLNKKGLRVVVLLGILGTAAGGWIKVLSAAPDRFWVAFIGQTVTAISQIFILGTPPHLAAVWFGADQVSSATAMGVFGNQVGIALGFVLPPLLVPYSSEAYNEEYTAINLRNMFLGVASFATAVLLLVIVFFKEKPLMPPSLAQLNSNSKEESFLKTIMRLLKNKAYLLLLVTYGINTGVFYAISTLLSQFIEVHFPNSSEQAGLIGLTMVVSGVLGSVVGGIILDKTHKFKETTIAIYALSFLGLLAFTLTIGAGHIEVVFLTSGLLGFFMTGYLPVGFEFAAELTYPEPEGTSSGLLNASAQVFGILLTLLAGYLLTSVSDLVSNFVLCGLLLVGSALTFLIRSDLRRQAAQTIQTTAVETVTEKIV
ncbi:uncharacterized MFS-type transporter C09D4.1-like isoform X2 [Artemia franciscana]|uniref:Choline/ethanolamine transporter FLVCR1 n=3 Tax=Artemia franciscana TaxID=6661 RepID=A0AA88I691_ARTSF|nr:hypothetical protein QYM36_002042 [Artemia franciscana]